MFDSFRFISITNSKKHGTVIRFVVPTFKVGNAFVSKVKMPNLSHFFATVIRSLTKTMGFFLSYYYVMITGLGLGIGLSVGAIVVQFPMSVQANPNELSNTRVAPVMPVSFESEELATLPAGQSLQWIPSNQAYVQAGSDLHDSNPLFLYAGIRNKMAWRLADFELGSTLKIIGENNGIYQFGVVGTRELAFSELFQADVWYEQEVDLVFYAPDTRNPGYFRVVLAKKI
jgi:hypothetical protein